MHLFGDDPGVNISRLYCVRINVYLYIMLSLRAPGSCYSNKHINLRWPIAGARIKLLFKKTESFVF